MNKAPDIKERKDLHSLDSPDPYKVFEFVPREVPGTWGDVTGSV